MVSRAESEGAVWAIGMMSGTSCDGIDAALIHTDGTMIDALPAAISSAVVVAPARHNTRSASAKSAIMLSM